MLEFWLRASVYVRLVPTIRFGLCPEAKNGYFNLRVAFVGVKRVFLVSFSVLLLAGCSIKQRVDPYVVPDNLELCIIEDPKVRQSFLDEYRRALDVMGVRTKLLPAGSSIRDCPVVSTYMARWSWDLTIYMTFAEIKVYEGGNLAGSAVYDSRSGGARLDKWKDAEKKIQELVSELFGTHA